MTAHAPKLVVIGGGTGSFTILSGLKHYVNDITALVGMADDGGSTGKLRDELGVLPPGDVRQCLVALSESSHKIRQLFNYRFPEGTTFAGHSFGNLFLSALEKTSHNFEDAAATAAEILKINGRVLPITLDECVLELQRINQETVTGEDTIGEAAIHERFPHISLRQPAVITAKAKQAIMDADLVVIAPGDLYTSLAPALIVDGVGDVLAQTTAKVVYVANLINKPHQTAGYDVTDYVAELERFAGKSFIDFVLYNTDLPTPELLQRYANEDEHPVVVAEQAMTNLSYTAIGGAFLSKQLATQDPNDQLQRTLIRHDGNLVARAIMRIHFS